MPKAIRTLFAGVLLAALPQAFAAQLRLSDGTPEGTVVITDQGPGDQNPTPGIIAYYGAIGANWFLNVTTGTVGSPGNPSPYMDLGSLNFSSLNQGVLTIEFTETNFLLSGTARAAIGGTTDGTVAYTTWVDAANAPFGKSLLLTTMGPFPGPSFNGTAVGTVGAGGPYSLTLQAVINHPIAGLSGFDAELSVTSAAPSITCLVPLTVSCSSKVPAPATDYASFVAQGGSVSSGCAGAITVTCLGDVMSASNCPNQFVLTRTYQATDACGNSASCTQSITVNDTLPPTITCPGDRVLACGDATEPSNTGWATAVDNCGGPVTIAYTDAATPANCTGKPGIDRTWTATDLCGNVTTCVQHITFADTTAPAISSIPADVTVSCASAVPAANEAAVVASDNCGGALTITHSDTLIPGSCANKFVLKRTYTARDACGNASSATQTVTVNDTNPPVFVNLPPATGTYQCYSDVPAAPALSATDNCGGLALVAGFSQTESNPGASCNNVITRTWTATDLCGNATTFTQKITVNDTLPPTIICPPDIQTNLSAGNLSVAVNYGSILATDNCSTVTIVANPPSGSSFTQGTTVVTVTATDACGNSASCAFKVVVTGGFATYTPGGWGAVPKGNNVASLLQKWFPTVYPKGLVVGGGYTVKLTSQLAVQNYLPDGSTPGVLKQNYLNPLTTSSGVFGNQVTALKLNLDFSNAGILPYGLANLKVAPGNKLAGLTVTQVLALANKVLGGATSALPAGCSVSDLNNLISGINQNFDNGTQNLGYLTY